MKLKELLAEYKSPDAEPLELIYEYLKSKGIDCEFKEPFDEIQIQSRTSYVTGGRFSISVGGEPSQIWLAEIKDNGMSLFTPGTADVIGEVDLYDPGSLDKIIDMIKSHELNG